MCPCNTGSPRRAGAGLRPAACILSLATTLAWATPECASLEGQWENEAGSRLEISAVTEDGRLQGRYLSSTGVDGRVFPLQGWVNTGESEALSIAWSVRWDGYSSITSWTGSCDHDGQGPRIATLWHLVRQDQAFDWERIITSASVFRPVPDVQAAHP